MKNQIFVIFLVISVLGGCKSESHENTKNTEDNKIIENQQTLPKYAPLANVVAGIGQCLTLNTDKAAIIFATCDGSIEQNWAFNDQGNGYAYIQNESNPEKCLNKDLKYISCALGPTENTTMRSWFVRYNLDETLSFSNLHNSNVQIKGALGVNASNLLEYSKFVDDKVIDSQKWTYSGKIELQKTRWSGDKSLLAVSVYWDGTQPVKEDTYAIGVSGNKNESIQDYLFVASQGKVRVTDTKFIPAFHLDQAQVCSQPRTTAQYIAEQLKLKKGIDPKDYSYFLINMPISCSDASAWSDGVGNGHHVVGYNTHGSYWLWAHELGHNMGSDHGFILQNCPSVNAILEIGDSCTVNKSPDDASDTLSGGGRRLFPVNYRLFYGWLTTTDVPFILKTGTYHLNKAFSHGVQGYRIPRSDGTNLVLEYRQPMDNIYENWEPTDPFVNGLIIRIENISGATIRNTIVDTTPNTSTSKDAPLLIGKSVHDTLSGATITLNAIDTQGAKISVYFD